MQEELFAMLGIGALLGLSLYAIAMFPLSRDWAALWLGLAMFCACPFAAAYDCHGYVYWQPDPPVSMMLSQISFNRFVVALIPLHAFGWRWAGRWLDALVLADLALLPPLLFGAEFHRLALAFPFLALACLLSFLSIGLAALCKGYRPAGNLVAGILVMVGIVVPRLGGTHGWLLFSSVSAQPIMAAVMFVASLLFFASINQRVVLLRREEAETLAALREAATRLEAQVPDLAGQLWEAKQRAERAERADLAKREFLARVSHELRTPLHTLLGYAHLLRRDVVGQPEERLASLEEGAHHLTKLVDDLLDYARGERGALAFNPKAVFLYRLLERLKEHGMALADKRHQQFATHFDANLPTVVRMDACRLEQVALILLSNAARYASGRITLAVQGLAAEADWTRLLFEVKDTGPGIAASDLARIFDPFERIGGENTGGLGLGLAIGRQIVRAMGGELRVDSQLGEGSRFWFELSLALASEEEIPPPFPDLDIVGYAGPPRGILVVEDHAANRALLEQLLAELGFAVYAAGSVGEGLDRLASASFDLTLLDQRLPDGTAWDILRTLRGGGRTATVKAVLLSAQPPCPPGDWGALPGFDALLLKPVGAAELLECIGSLLGLTWIWAEEAAMLAGLDETSRAAASRALPSAAECAELAELARRGAVYEIEAWTARLSQIRPECREFCRKVETRLAALDFKGIAAIATQPA